MKSFILACTLILGSTQALADAPIESVAGSPFDSQRVKILSDDILGQQGVTFFNEILKQSRLYALLVSLESEAPTIANSLKYAALLNEAHFANQTLSRLVIALNRQNRLIEKLFHNGEIMSG